MNTATLLNLCEIVMGILIIMIGICMIFILGLSAYALILSIKDLFKN